MIRIYGHPMSTCTRKVLTTLEETGTAYDLTVVDFATGEHKQEPHLSRQPFGQVPAIEDGDFRMFESRAICRYINDKAKGKLVPGDLQCRARMEQWVSIETTQFSGAAMKFIFEHVFKRPQGPEVLQEAQAKVDLCLNVMEGQLSGRTYLAGSDFSLADLCFMPYVEYAMATPLEKSIAQRANVAAWWKRLSERPSWRKVTGKG